MPSDESLALLTFFQTIFPEELYAIPAAIPADIPAGEAPPLAATAATDDTPDPVTAHPPADVLPHATEAAAPPEPHATQVSTSLPAPTPSPVSSPVSTPASPMPAPVPAFIPGTTHLQSRGDGSGAVVIQRLPAAEFAQLNQNDFWQNFLRYLKLDWSAVRFVNVLTAAPLPLADVLASAPDTPRLLLFGSGLVSPLPPEAPAYDRYTLANGGPKLLRAHAIADLTPERKRLLLAAVAPWVGK